MESHEFDRFFDRVLSLNGYYQIWHIECVCSRAYLISLKTFYTFTVYCNFQPWKHLQIFFKFLSIKFLTISRKPTSERHVTRVDISLIFGLHDFRSL